MRPGLPRLRELQGACRYQYVIPNHDGEDVDNWEAFYYLIGDARKTLEAFAALFKGSVAPSMEQWEEESRRRTRASETAGWFA